MLAEDLEHNCTRSQQSEQVNEREGNNSRQVEVEDPDIVPIVESDQISTRDSDRRKSESAFAKVEYEEEEPVPFNEEEGEDLDGSISDHSHRMRQLEYNARLAARRLLWAENQLKQERKMFHENVQTRTVKTRELRRSNRMRRDHPPEEDDQSGQYELKNLL